MQNFARSIRILLSLASIALVPEQGLADGGALQAIQEQGEFRISVFTSPAILTEGDVDISVMVQEASSHRVVDSAKVEVIIAPRSDPSWAEHHVATADLATNAMLKACHVQLSAGWHDVEVRVNDQGRNARISVALSVGPAPTRAASFWPWFTWPAIPIVLVVANLAYRQLRGQRSAIIKGQAARLEHTST